MVSNPKFAIESQHSSVLQHRAVSWLHALERKPNVPNLKFTWKVNYLNMDFVKSYFDRNEPLTSWTLLSPVFFQISTSYKIHTLPLSEPLHDCKSFDQSQFQYRTAQCGICKCKLMVLITNFGCCYFGSGYHRVFSGSLSILYGFFHHSYLVSYKYVTFHTK